MEMSTACIAGFDKDHSLYIPSRKRKIVGPFLLLLLLLQWETEMRTSISVTLQRKATPLFFFFQFFCSALHSLSSCLLSFFKFRPLFYCMIQPHFSLLIPLCLILYSLFFSFLLFGRIESKIITYIHSKQKTLFLSQEVLIFPLYLPFSQPRSPHISWLSYT